MLLVSTLLSGSNRSCLRTQRDHNPDEVAVYRRATRRRSTHSYNDDVESLDNPQESPLLSVLDKFSKILFHLTETGENLLLKCVVTTNVLFFMFFCFFLDISETETFLLFFGDFLTH